MFDYGYSTTGSCYAEKGASFTFINGKLETYHVFSELAGEASFTLNPQKLAGLKPGETSRSAVVEALGTPNYWSTGITLTTELPEELGYYWIAERSPLIVWNRLLITFDENGKIKSQPLIERRGLVDLSMGMWLCRFPPPVS